MPVETRADVSTGAILAAGRGRGKRDTDVAVGIRAGRVQDVIRLSSGGEDGPSDCL